jgi:catechol 2,3-dioxygenase-like lactoylglutathione lyase family enzyme
MTVTATQGINMKTTGVHHVSLRSTDLARAKVFYIERLGFPLLFETGELFLFLAGGTAIGVRGPSPNTPADDAFDPFRVGLDHVALGCTDALELQRVAAALTEAGVEHTGVKTDALLQKDYIAFKDPDGIKWELYSADDADAARRAALRSAADAYFAALARGDFDAIPYADDVVLRAPIVPGGAANPLSGRETLRTVWWQPLVPALDGVSVRVIDYYANADATAICVAAEITLPVAKATLRVADRFRVDANGRITEQENHFDPRAVT